MKFLFTLFSAVILTTAVHAQYALKKFDINTGVGVGSDPFGYTSFKGKTYFYASDNVHGTELWWTDGISYGMVADLNPGIGGSAGAGAPNLCELGGNLYFAANDGQHGDELFMYNGVDSPTILADIDTNAFAGSFPQHITALKGRLYFVATDTMGLRNIWVYNPLTHAYYEANNTLTTTSMNISDMMAFGDKLLFVANITGYGAELFSYDPISDFMTLEADIEAGAQGSFPQAFVPYKNVVFFTAITAAAGRELYMYDGVNAPSLVDITPGPTGSFNFTTKDNFAIYNDNLYFPVFSLATFANMLWKYNPYLKTLDSIKSIVSVNPIHDLAVYGKNLLLVSDSGSFIQNMYVYKMGDTIANPISKFVSTPAIGNPYGTTVSYGKAYFSAMDPLTFETELYVYTDSVALDVRHVSFNADVTVYPNPTRDLATVRLVLREAAMLNIRLMDMTGREVYSTGLKQYEAATHDVAIPTSVLAAGNYFYTITSASGRLEYRGKLVKE